MTIAVGLGSAYAQYGELPLVHRAFAGLAAAAAGLILATACKIAWPLRNRRSIWRWQWWRSPPLR